MGHRHALTDEDVAERVVGTAVTELGRVDVVVNNARARD
jgi:NAD(P)-dependent dehydrogenase (short-subunit alcohol dehydrogenase family)